MKKEFEDWLHKVSLLADKLYKVDEEVIYDNVEEFYQLYEVQNYTPRRAVEHFASTYL